MFTGLIEATGKVVEIEKKGVWRLAIASELPQMEVGSSIAVNGVCLTVVFSRKNLFNVEVMRETLERSNLSLLRIGDEVNLERPLRIGDRLEGHFVLGHVDCMGKVIEVIPESGSRRMWISIPEEYTEYVVSKGSIAIDGVSLTIAGVKGSSFSVVLIPHTLKVTTLSLRKVGDLLNIEFDIIGKYIRKMLKGEEEKGVTLDLLKKYGFL
ncbi:MAG: riboflavin synthase [Synergistetes bacterium]|nr:riboflavin synthase [Synergistota bacterium]MDW8191441.1 riboflavin synthase [Synergistota bacterium]